MDVGGDPRDHDAVRLKPRRLDLERAWEFPQRATIVGTCTNLLTCGFELSTSHQFVPGREKEAPSDFVLGLGLSLSTAIEDPPSNID